MISAHQYTPGPELAINMNVSSNPLGTVYATKRRRRSNKSINKSPQKKEPDGPDAKSNPSKRHRERLNGELDHLASLLPFEQNILSKLDRLSILRLAVAFLRTKTFFQGRSHVSMQRERDELVDGPYRRDFLTYDNHILDGDIFLQALNGFLMILDCNGELFFATHTIETYLGFHQSDVIHQSVYELVHSEDREELQRQLGWDSFLGQEEAGVSLQELLASDQHHLLDRSFTVRFRCLLDNTSGFLRLDIRGKIKVLHGQNKKTEEAPLALFCLCTPFGPPSLLEIPHKEVMFKSKHKLDFGFVSMDQRGKEMLQFDDEDLSDIGGYDLVHHDDLAYVASAHQELLKTGASGMIAYRLQTKEQKWQWLQTSSRLVYKNSKPDFIISTHRPLMEEEGRDLLGKRTMDFKVTYLDAGLTSAYFNEGETPNSNGSSTGNSVTPSGGGGGGTGTGNTATKVPKRYKAHLRDFLSSCRTKRSKNHHNSSVSASDIYAAAVNDPAAAAAALALPYATVYSTPPSAASAYPTDNPLYMQQNIASSPYQTIYPVDNRYFSTEYLASYRSLTATYYPEYAAASHAAAGYIGNGYFDVASPRSLTSIPYDAASQFNRYFEAEKVDCKYNPNAAESPKPEYVSPPGVPQSQPQPPQQHPNSE